MIQLQKDFMVHKASETGTRPSTDHRVHVSAGTPQGGWQRYQEARRDKNRHVQRKLELEAVFFGNGGGKM